MGCMFIYSEAKPAPTMLLMINRMRHERGMAKCGDCGVFMAAI